MLTLFLTLSTARAYYIAPPLSTVAMGASSVADVKVTHIDERGDIHIKLKKLINGEPPPDEITGVVLSCTSEGPPHGMNVGSRYIVILQGERMYTETSFFEIKGKQCHAWSEDDSYARTWQPCAPVIALLQSVEPLPLLWSEEP